MEFLEDHKNNPRHMVRPLFVDEEIYLDDKDLGGVVKLYLEVDKKRNRVQSLSFVQESPSFWTPFFSALCVLSRGMKLDKAKALSWVDFLNYFEEDPVMKDLVGRGKLPLLNQPLFLLSELIDRFTHTEIRPSEESSQRGKLICRCFGVYEEEIKDVVREEGFSSLRGVLDETCAGGGCNTCKPQIQEILSRETLGGPTIFDVFEETGKVPRIDSMTPVEVILKSEKILSAWKEKGAKSHNFEIVGLRGRCLDIKSFFSDTSDPLLSHQVEHLLKEGVSKELSVKFLHFSE